MVCNSGHSENFRLAFSIVGLKVSFPHMAEYAPLPALLRCRPEKTLRSLASSALLGSLLCGVHPPGLSYRTSYNSKIVQI